MSVKPNCVILSGVPASGKSTYAEGWANMHVRVSSDQVIEDLAFEHDMTYSEMFSYAIKYSNETAIRNFKNALATGTDVIIDRTNLTKKSRRMWIQDAKKAGYQISCVSFAVPSNLNERLASRIGKNIPEDVIKTMIENYQKPEYEEGFDLIIEGN